MILHDLITYDALRLIWWALMGLLLIGFVLTDGFDLGAMALMPAISRSDAERRAVIETVEPVWEGNQVWLILGAGAIFAAWPPVYAVAFSGFYLVMFVVLAALILRPVAFKFRSKRRDPGWRAWWDRALVASGLVPALIFGMAVGNVLRGLPFRLTDDLHAVHTLGGLARMAAMLHPFALLTGLTAVAILLMHGAAWLSVKADEPMATRARVLGTRAGMAGIAGYLLAGLWLALGSGAGLPGYAAAPHVAGAASNPLTGEVLRQGSWLAAYGARPWIAAAPLLGLAGAAAAILGLRRGGGVATLLASQAGLAGMVASVGLTMFPVILPSSVDVSSSLTVWNASASHLSLFLMLVATAVFLPLVMAYTAWVYRVLWGRVTLAEAAQEGDPHDY